MRLTRRLFACAVPLLLAACAATPPAVDPAVRPALALTGTLRVGVYPGSPSSLVKDPRTGQDAGVAHDLGLALGERLGVPVRIVQYSRVAQVVDAIGAGQVDFTFTNASEAQFKSASIVTAASMADARQLLQRRGVDAFATTRASSTNWPTACRSRACRTGAGAWNTWRSPSRRAAQRRCRSCPVLRTRCERAAIWPPSWRARACAARRTDHQRKKQ